MEQIRCPNCWALLDIYNVKDVPDELFAFHDLTGYIMPVIDSTTMIDELEKGTQ